MHLYLHLRIPRQKTGLSTISEILRNRRLSHFDHVARLDPEVPANKALDGEQS